MHGRWYTDAGVFDIKLKRTIDPRIANFNPTFNSEFQGVVDQIGEYLGELGVVGQDDAFAICKPCITLQTQSFFADFKFEKGAKILQLNW